MQRIRLLRPTLLAGLATLSWLAPASAQETLGPPDATLELASTSVAAGIGVSWGRGTLRFEDQEHPFSVNGLSVLDVGISRVTATGRVWGLEKLEDFNGTYTGVNVGAAVGGGTEGVAMRNQNGVYIKLRAGQQGVRFSLASKGTTLKLEEP